ncbi:MAG: penicillin-binding protein 2 [Candidatus Aminicenantaceae bacterium]
MAKSILYEDLSTLLRRAKKIKIIVIVIFIVLIVSFWKIQILDNKEYLRKSESNLLREIVLKAPRGLIKDRNGKILADNVASFKASIIRENCEDLDSSVEQISKLLNMEKTVLEERIMKYESLPEFKPIVVKENLSRKELSILSARQLEYPELVIQTEPKRSYPYNSFASHVLGYLQEITKEELKQDFYKDRRLGDIVGKTGVEKKYESEILGIDGQIVEIVDSLGRKKGERSRREPVRGQDLKLTLDFELQKKSEDLLEGKEGVIIILNPNTGEIYAMASYPDFDPNRFINRFTPEEWKDLTNSPEFPLENRAIRGLYAPGSVFKLTMALSSLDMNVITPKKTFFCRGKAVFYGHPFSCWLEYGHGKIDLISGIQHSCNIYFYNLGKRLGIESISKYAKMLGFGKKTGIDLIDEKKGLFPDETWKKRVRNEPWYPGETISIAIGQGPILVTPVQIAVHTAFIANRGRVITPHLVMTEGNEKDRLEKPEWIDIKNSSFEYVIKGMWKAVNEHGTAKAAMVPEFQICGKTGSTQLVSKETAEKMEKKDIEIKTHSWFTGFAPKDEPEVVITVLVEYGGWGGETAALLARELFQLFRETYD